HPLARGHCTDEVTRPNELARVARDAAELAGDGEAVDRGCEREDLRRHVGTGGPVDLLEQINDVGALDLGGDARAPARKEMFADHLLDPGPRPPLPGARPPHAFT